MINSKDDQWSLNIWKKEYCSIESKKWMKCSGWKFHWIGFSIYRWLNRLMVPRLHPRSTVQSLSIPMVSASVHFSNDVSSIKIDEINGLALSPLQRPYNHSELIENVMNNRRRFLFCFEKFDRFPPDSEMNEMSVQQVLCTIWTLICPLGCEHASMPTHDSSIHTATTCTFQFSICNFFVFTQPTVNVRLQMCVCVLGFGSFLLIFFFSSSLLLNLLCIFRIPFFVGVVRVVLRLDASTSGTHTRYKIYSSSPHELQRERETHTANEENEKKSKRSNYSVNLNMYYGWRT